MSGRRPCDPSAACVLCPSALAVGRVGFSSIVKRHKRIGVLKERTHLTVV